MPTRSDPPGTALVTLRLKLGTETISGTLEDLRGGERPFWGWLELSAALDQTRGIDPGRRPSSGGLEERVDMSSRRVPSRKPFECFLRAALANAF
jgi:hypothetical protein